MWEFASIASVFINYPLSYVNVQDVGLMFDPELFIGITASQYVDRSQAKQAMNLNIL